MSKKKQGSKKPRQRQTETETDFLYHHHDEAAFESLTVGDVVREYGLDSFDPRNWGLDIPQDRIDLYLELSDSPRNLTAAEAAMLVEVIDAWRRHEHFKHIALMHALATEYERPKTPRDRSDK
jgi:hypothetical protein